ncbi:MAG: hypothetical protein BEN18_01905 [Epulopiscium sp. Nuni2H_MBin001]|nr:MAG: hypothetical protein BEN18_01905 [Epulopiscium sp. Nuni2H_MBin001]
MDNFSNLVDSSEMELVDIRTIKVDKSLPKPERIKEFVRQVKNPYRFKCDEMIIAIEFTPTGRTLDESILDIMGR